MTTPDLKTFLVSLGVLAGIVAGPSVWHAAQRSYADFRCTGEVDAQGQCQPDVRNVPDPGSAPQPGAPTPLGGTVTGAAPAPSAGATPELSGLGLRAPGSVDALDHGNGATYPTADQGDPIALLNVERQRAGIGLLSGNVQLANAASSHSRYLVDNHQFAHEEMPGAPDFLGRTPHERILAMGYGRQEQRLGTGEVIATLGGDTSDGINSLMTAIYHRLVMLNPSFQEVGAGVINNGDSLMLTMDFGVRGSTYSGEQPLRLVVYPTPSQTGIPYRFVPGHETPNPAPERATVGYPISAQVAPNHTLVISNVVLRDASGQALPGKVLSAGNDPEITASEWAFLPWDPLQPSSTYGVSLDGSVDGQPFHTAWSFTTAADAPLQTQVMQSVLRPGEQTWVLYSKTNASAWQVSAESTGAENVPIQILQQGWRGLQVRALSSCLMPGGCPVTLTVRDDQGHTAQASLRVMP